MECAKRIEAKKMEDVQCVVPLYVEVQKIFDPGNIESEIRKKNNERKEMSRLKRLV